jgi:hypothetical protein
MVIETDMVENYVGSSYSWATTKGLVKFGFVVFAQRKLEWRQILDESWVNTQQTTNTQGEYGHFG